MVTLFVALTLIYKDAEHVRKWHHVWLSPCLLFTKVEMIK